MCPIPKAERTKTEIFFLITLIHIVMNLKKNGKVTRRNKNRG